MDQSIIVAAASGDDRAFKAIFDFYIPKLRPLALRYARSSDEAKDILQESFLKIFNNLKSYKFDGSFEGWLKRIVINTAIKAYHKNQKDHLFIEAELAEEDVAEEEGEEIDTEDPNTLLKLLQLLPDGYRLVINLYVLEELSHREIAQMLNIAESTSRSQYSKGKKMLMKMLVRQRK